MKGIPNVGAGMSSFPFLPAFTFVLRPLSTKENGDFISPWVKTLPVSSPDSEISQRIFGKIPTLLAGNLSLKSYFMAFTQASFIVRNVKQTE